MPSLDNELPPQVQAALARGQKIEAIKLLREARGMGLKEAKEAVEAHDVEGRLGGVSVVQSGGHGALFWLLGLLLLGCAVVGLLGWF